MCESRTWPVPLYLCFLLCAILFVTLPAAANSKAESIPFTTNADGMVIIPASVGQANTVHVILDTGAGLAVLAPSLIEKGHGIAAGQFTGFRMEGERIDIPLFVIPALKIGAMEQKNVLVGSWDLLDKWHLDGIVSLRQFTAQPFTLDFVNKVLVLETPETLAKRKAAGSMSPLQFDEQRNITLDMFAKFLFDGQPGQCEIDTGSPSASLSTRYLALLGIDKDGKDVHKVERKTETGVTVVRYYATLRDVSLATVPAIKLASPRVALGDLIYDCVIGVDFWSGRALTVDIPDHQIIVSNPAATH